MFDSVRIFRDIERHCCRTVFHVLDLWACLYQSQLIEMFHVSDLPFGHGSETEFWPRCRHTTTKECEAKDSRFCAQIPPPPSPPSPLTQFRKRPRSFEAELTARRSGTRAIPIAAHYLSGPLFRLLVSICISSEQPGGNGNRDSAAVAHLFRRL